MSNRVFFLFCVLITISACSPKYYSPNTLNVPLISQKAETNLTVAGNGNQIEFQAAYGMTNSFSLMANGGLYIPAELDNGNGGSGKLAEIGGGYFRKILDNWLFESYAILGYGTFENHLPSTIASFPQTTGKISGSIFRIGVQPSFGYKSKYLSAAVSARLSNLNYSNINGDLIFDNVDQVKYLNENSGFILIEPALTLKAGLEKVKIQIQYTYSLNASERDFKQDKSNLTFGLNFNFQ